jgi:hypothetical protein
MASGSDGVVAGNACEAGYDGEKRWVYGNGIDGPTVNFCSENMV